MASKSIEDIVPDPRREGSVRLVSAGRTLLSVPAAVVHAERIEVGGLVEPPQLQRLEEVADREAAYRTAVRLLERRPFAARDLGRRLKLKGHPAAAVAAALERATSAGYLDDARFAVHFVQSRMARGRGPARLRRELLAAGVAEQHIEAALAPELADPRAGEERIRGLIAKRLPQLTGRPDQEVKRRLLAYLARRGYRGPEATNLVRAAMQRT